MGVAAGKVGGMSDGEEERKGEKAQELESESIEHLAFLVEFIEEEFKDVIFETRNYLPEGLIPYERYDTPFHTSLLYQRHASTKR